MPGLCSIEGCGREHYAGGLCSTHYMRQRRGANLAAPVREKRTGESLKQIKTRISDDAYQKLKAKADEKKTSVYDLAAEILERWSQRQD